MGRSHRIRGEIDERQTPETMRWERPRRGGYPGSQVEKVGRGGSDKLHRTPQTGLVNMSKELVTMVVTLCPDQQESAGQERTPRDKETLGLYLFRFSVSISSPKKEREKKREKREGLTA